MNIIVCDDEKEILENIKNYLSDTTYNILTYDSYEKLEKAIKKELFNILILDIKLGNKSGIEFISKYQELLKNTKLIYITGYDEFIEDTFETNPTYLLRKPLNKEKINKAISKAIKELENEERFLFVKHLNETIKLKQKDILYIESDVRKVNKNDENLKNDNNDLQEIQKEESLTNEIMPDNIVTCTLVQDHRTFKNIFYFNDGVIYKYRIEHVFPDDVNIDEYYNDEVDMNAGTYNISRNGQTIIYDLDNTMYYWEYFNYKDEPYRRIYKIFTEDGWSCEG